VRQIEDCASYDRNKLAYVRGMPISRDGHVDAEQHNPGEEYRFEGEHDPKHRRHQRDDTELKSRWARVEEVPSETSDNATSNRKCAHCEPADR
jgi:hypothetical protein